MAEYDGGGATETEINKVLDGGRADTKYGGTRTIDCGYANTEATETNE